MLKSLSSRLFTSYVAVIVTGLLLVALALLGFAAFSNSRLLTPLQRLAAISLDTRYEISQLSQERREVGALRDFLQETAAAQNVRILIVEARTRRVVFDSDPEGAWQGVVLREINRPPLTLPSGGPNAIYGRFRRPGDGSWLVYGLPAAEPGRFLIFFAQPEPTPLRFFRETFLRPLCGAGLVSLILSALLAWWITRSVSQPLQAMAGASEAMAEGDYDQQVTPAGPEEVRRVAHSFNTMAAQVKRTQQAQRDFVANVSHDLKTPITSISGWSQALLDGTAVSPREQEQAAAVIHSESQRMSRMVRQLLALARIESDQLRLNRRPVDLAELLEAVRQMFAVQASEAEVELVVETTPLPPIPGDPDRLLQLFANLVDNAVAYTPPGGRVALSLQSAGDMALVQVRDTGPGIDEAEAARIFERFYQVDKSRSGERRGAGLGLAIVRQLAEAHNGRVEVHSRPGEGSAFTVYLPLHDT